MQSFLGVPLIINTLDYLPLSLMIMDSLLYICIISGKINRDSSIVQAVSLTLLASIPSIYSTCLEEYTIYYSITFSPPLAS